LYKGPLRHEAIPNYLNASDVFVLPTLREGCCNAIVEAMSCGLPIISSNLSFNLDVLDNTNSILIDPNDIDAIAVAIKKLRDDKELRRQMSEASLKKAKELNIYQRAKDIISFISLKM
jgi:glycosyltransferase involved in cell wall biosynthesis